MQQTHLNIQGDNQSDAARQTNLIMAKNTDNASFAVPSTPSRSLKTRNVPGAMGTVVQMPHIKINMNHMALNSKYSNRFDNRDMIEFVVDKKSGRKFKYTGNDLDSSVMYQTISDFTRTQKTTPKN